MSPMQRVGERGAWRRCLLGLCSAAALVVGLCDACLCPTCLPAGGGRGQGASGGGRAGEAHTPRPAVHGAPRRCGGAGRGICCCCSRGQVWATERRPSRLSVRSPTDSTASPACLPADPNSGGSSFSIMLGAAPHLNNQYTGERAWLMVGPRVQVCGWVPSLCCSPFPPLLPSSLPPTTPTHPSRPHSVWRGDAGAGDAGGAGGTAHAAGRNLCDAPGAHHHPVHVHVRVRGAEAEAGWMMQGWIGRRTPARAHALPPPPLPPPASQVCSGSGQRRHPPPVHRGSGGAAGPFRHAVGAAGADSAEAAAGAVTPRRRHIWALMAQPVCPASLRASAHVQLRVTLGMVLWDCWSSKEDESRGGQGGASGGGRAIATQVQRRGGG